VTHLAGLVARTDAPMRLPDAAIAAIALAPRTAPSRPDALLGDAPDGTAAAVLHSAVVQHLQVAPAEQHAAILARARLLRTHADAFTYLEEVRQLVRAKRVELGLVHA
jgi:hypothetical protein